MSRRITIIPGTAMWDEREANRLAREWRAATGQRSQWKPNNPIRSIKKYDGFRNVPTVEMWGDK